MLPSISIGPLLLQTPGLVLLLGVWIGSSLAEKEADRLSVNKDAISKLVFYSLVAGIVGSRLAYAAQTPNIYLDNPLSLLALDANTLAPLEGLVIGIFTSLIIGQRQGLSLRPTLDVLAPGLAAFMITWTVSNILSGDAFGSASQLPWAIYLWGESRHPVQFYELFLAVIIFIIILQQPLKKLGFGMNFLILISLSSLSRLVTEVFRGDSLIWLGYYRAAQLISLIILVSSLWLMNKWALSNVKSKR